MTRPSRDSVHITPLGGVGEFGMNCMLVELGDYRYMIDCGVMFPEPEHFGVDMLVPRFDALREPGPSGRRLDALLLTHGHEDHIGAVPYLVKALREMGENAKLPIYLTPFTDALVRNKLGEHDLLGAVDLSVVKPGLTFEARGGLSVETIPVNHSIADAVSLVLDTPAGRILHTGDWRIDHTPVGEAPIDLQRFAELGRKGCVAMFGDSTNAGVPGSTLSEAIVADALLDAFDLAPGRVIITQFSSNVWRLQSVVNAAWETGRRVVLAGRSVRQNFAAARELGLIKVPDGDVVIDGRDMDKLPPHEVVLVASGSQGEPQSTLTRIAWDQHNRYAIQKDDWVIYSVRQIPGNEKRIAQVADQLIERGARVLKPSQKQPLHTSGHASSDEMRVLLNLIKPRYLVPIHGGIQQLRAHAELGNELGLETVSIRDGDQIRLDRNGGLKLEKGCLPAGYQFVCGNELGLVDDETVRQRRQIGFGGFVAVDLILDHERERVLNGPAILDYGITSDAEVLEGARRAVLDALDELDDFSDLEEVGETMRLAVRRHLRRALDRKPIVFPRVLALDLDADELTS